MKKIMFNDRYGLTQAVIDGRKTMTRRIVKGLPDVHELRINYGVCTLRYTADASRFGMSSVQPRYKLDEVVAVAQNYKDAGYTPDLLQEGFFYQIGTNTPMEIRNTPEEYIGKWMECHFDELAGWSNKMFVLADLMPRRIRITDIKVERLQDISEEDCMNEGIMWDYEDYLTMRHKVYLFNDYESFSSPRLAFAALIDRMFGKSTWGINPWVFAYTFELVEGGQQ